MAIIILDLSINNQLAAALEICFWLPFNVKMAPVLTSDTLLFKMDNLTTTRQDFLPFYLDFCLYYKCLFF
jgi:hypothetical protein